MVIERLSQENINTVYCWWKHDKGGAKGARFVTETATFAAYLNKINELGWAWNPDSRATALMSLIGVGMLAGALAQQEDNEGFGQDVSPSEMMHSLQLVDVGSPEDPFPPATNNTPLKATQSCTLQLIQLQPRFALISEGIGCLSELADSECKKLDGSTRSTNRCPFIPFLIGAAAMGINFDEAWDWLIEEA